MFTGAALFMNSIAQLIQRLTTRGFLRGLFQQGLKSFPDALP
jgi:hypothetical protein